MLLKRVYDDDLAQASYLVGCQATGSAIVVDPRRDVGVYLDEAERSDMRIVAVTETHMHADYLSGARELAAAVGAKLYLSDEGGPDWRYAFEHEALVDGSTIRIGNLRLEAVHTPGHTPEHLSFLLTDGAATAAPGFLLSGDFVFVGDVGRPDLLDEATGAADTRGPLARLLFRSLRDRFWTLPDWVQVLPGHGAGSACGRALGAVESSTVGYEKLVSWWAHYVRDGDEAGFVSALLDGQPDAPSYFGRMKRWNREGPPLLGDRPAPTRLSGDELADRLAGGALLLDTRPKEEYGQGAVDGSLHVPAGRNFATWAAWILDPETDRREIVLLAADRDEAVLLRDKLARIGVDDVRSYVTGLDGLDRRPTERLSPRELEGLGDAFILDIRSSAEHSRSSIPGALHIPGGSLLRNLDDLPRNRLIVVHCQSGARSAVIASAMRAAGFENLIELEGGFRNWESSRSGQDSTAGARDSR